MEKETYIFKEKAYGINLDRLKEGYLSNEIICYAESLNKAKSKLLEQVKYK
ncbi:MAG: hypothetical protein WC026_13200 [Hyphomicrobium sp.]|uniref:hypothetical protein n=1 Tax=Hyphomicrobium sp. TaxID=82 RepID=UPI003563CC78